MRREHRLRKRSEFERTRSNGRSWAHPLLVCFAYPRGDERPSRFGVSVSTRVGNAVTRNRIKRRVREALRLHPTGVKPGYDVVFVARAGSARATFAELSGALDALLVRAGVRAARQSDHGEEP